MKTRIFAVLTAHLVAVFILGGCYFFDATVSQVNQQPLPETQKQDAEASFAKEGMEWRLLAWRDENGEIPENPITEALDLRDYHLDQLDHPDGFSDGGVARLNWISRGPANVGGRTRAIVIHPTETNTIWAASVSGGVWKSTDRGNSWAAANGRLQNYAVVTLAINPTNPNILYAGTGESLAGDGIRGNGIFKSVDGGITWNHLEETEGWKFVSRIAVSANGNIILASTTGDEDQSRGILRSDDEGATWPVSKLAADSLTVVFHPTDSDRAIAEIKTLTGCPGVTGSCHKVIYATNCYEEEEEGEDCEWSDAQIILQPSASPTPFLRGNDQRIELTYAKGDPNYVFALHGEDCNFNFSCASISRSENGGAAFNRMNTTHTQNQNGQCGGPGFQARLGASNYNNTIWAWDQNLVIAGGVSLHRSENGGNDIILIAHGDLIAEDPHTDMHCIVPDPGYNGTTNKQVYVCNDGGVYKTENIEDADCRETLPLPRDWRSLNNGFVSTQFYAAAGNGNGTSGLIYGGTQDNAQLRVKSGETNAQFGWGGDGGGSAVDPGDPNYCYGEFVGIVLHRTTNCVSNPNTLIQDIDFGLTDISPPSGGSVQTSFVNRFILDPNDSTNNTMLYGGRSLWKTTNVKITATPGQTPAQPTWIKIKDNGDDVPATTPTASPTPTPPPPNKMRITAVAVAEGDPNNIWVAESDLLGNSPKTPDERNGRLYRYDVETDPPSWTRVDANPTPLPDRYLSRIAIDPSNPNTVYAAFGGFYTNNLWRTVNAGATWAPISGTADFVLPKAPIRGIAVHPTDSNKLYAGTEIGVYVSGDAGQHWAAVMEGPSNVSVDEISFMRGSQGLTTKLLVATHGRGLWTTDVGAPYTGGHPPNDFDGDGRSDIAVVRTPVPSPAGTPSTWYLRRSLLGYTAVPWGLPGDQIVADDFDGDGKTDITVFRESNHTMYSLQSGDSTTVTTYFGDDGDGDTAVSGDFNGDDVADEAVYRIVDDYGYWIIFPSGGTTYYVEQWGVDGDVPVAEDFDGDGSDDLAVFRLRYGVWYLVYSGDGRNPTEVQFGLGGDIPVAGDYNGEGSADIAIWRPSEARWYLAYAENQFATYMQVPWGSVGDYPVPGDYDGDGKYDIAVWRPTDGNWYIRQSTNGIQIVHFGANGDKPVGRKTDTGINARPGAPSEIRSTPPSWARPQSAGAGLRS